MGLLFVAALTGGFGVPTAVGGGDRDRAVQARAEGLARAALALAAHPGPDTDMSLALTDLFRTRHALTGSERAQADALLSRPTAGARDPYGDGYTVPSRRVCNDFVCVHWVRTTRDAPPSRAWVTSTLKVMGLVWRTEVGKLGYHRPLKDGTRGGNAKLDIYLKNVGAKGYYGYCAPEKRVAGAFHTASGYCVLDNDFSRAEFGLPPWATRKVTAAHEFFHAVQYAYDVDEDRWLMEATATWVEERVADSVNDNRQYLRYGQLGSPGTPLDSFQNTGFAQYGNWLFFEHLSQAYGATVVRQIWREAGQFAGAGKRYSVAAIAAVLAARGSSLPEAYARFASANVIPQRTYVEGAAYPRKAPTTRRTLAGGALNGGGDVRHLTSRTDELDPDPSLTDPGTKLTLEFTGTGTPSQLRAFVTSMREDGTVGRTPVILTPEGTASLTIPFNTSLTAVYITVVNGSGRYQCRTGTVWACEGTPLDDGAKLTWKAQVQPPA